MLDANIDKIFSIEATLPSKAESASKVLLLRACKIYIFDSNRIYSEFEEQTFDALNDDRGYGVLDIEFVLVNSIVKEGYPQFYTKCFVMRTDAEEFIKPMKFSSHPTSSKINQKGELVVGVRYYFRDEREIEKIVTSNSLLIEGFIALEKPTNVFGIMCQLHKGKKRWKITSAYTYKPKYAKNIKYLID